MSLFDYLSAPTLAQQAQATNPHALSTAVLDAAGVPHQLNAGYGTFVDTPAGLVAGGPQPLFVSKQEFTLEDVDGRISQGSGLENDLYVRAALRQDVERTPAWMMRQAGRYLPEYLATRKQAGDFMSLCKNAELACEVTMQPLRRYNLDAAILFSDILTVPDAMGLGLYFAQGEGPHFERPVATPMDVYKLCGLVDAQGNLDAKRLANVLNGQEQISQAPGLVDIASQLNYVPKAVRTIARELKAKVPLIGFSGSPWTLATYMVEGKPSKSFINIKAMMYREPQALHLLLSLLATNVTNYLNAQIAAGASAVMVFDTWGGVLGHAEYEEFSLRYMEQIARGLIRDARGQRVPVTFFTKGGGQWLERLVGRGADAVGVDWTTNLATARRQVGDTLAFQGNLDPSVLYAAGAVTSAGGGRAWGAETANEQVLRQAVRQVVADYALGAVSPEKARTLVLSASDAGASQLQDLLLDANGQPLSHQDLIRGHVFNLGHGIHQNVDPSAPEIMLDELARLTSK